VILCPARLDPTFSPRPWGSLSLAPFFPEESNLKEPFGEAWLTGDECRFASGPFVGRKLGEVWPAMPVEWAGTKADRGSFFPLLVKFIFSEDKLSVQVHPDDAYAAQHEQAAGGRGKTEMWYAMRARPGAEVLVGLKPDATHDGFASAIKAGTAEDFLARVPLSAGDAVFVPAGTAHTIGPGLVLCEIQQHSDLTYRVYDYDRRDAQGRTRELHIEKALDVIRFGEQRGGKIVPAKSMRGDCTQTFLVACRYFATEKWEFSERVAAITSSEHFDLIVIVEGSGTFQWNGDEAEFASTQVWIIPASLGAYHVTPHSRTSLLRTCVPTDSEEIFRRLKEAGVEESKWSQLVHL